MYYDVQNITLHGQRQTIQMRLHENFWKATVSGNQATSSNPSNFDMNSRRNCFVTSMLHFILFQSICFIIYSVSVIDIARGI